MVNPIIQDYTTTTKWYKLLGIFFIFFLGWFITCSVIITGAYSGLSGESLSIVNMDRFGGMPLWVIFEIYFCIPFSLLVSPLFYFLYKPKPFIFEKFKMGYVPVNYLDKDYDYPIINNLLTFKPKDVKWIKNFSFETTLKYSSTRYNYLLFLSEDGGKYLFDKTYFAENIFQIMEHGIVKETFTFDVKSSSQYTFTILLKDLK